MHHIELFAGCGGLSLGLETAGFELFLANELSPMASETFARNLLSVDFDEKVNSEKVFWLSSEYTRSNLHARLRENPQLAVGLKENHHSDVLGESLTLESLKRSLLVGSISDMNSILTMPQSPLLDILEHSTTGGIDLLSGGPPCQSFSLAGLRDPSNQRNTLPWEFAKFAELIKPKIVLLENVSGILRPFKIKDTKYYAWFEVAKAFAKVGYVPLCLNINAKYVGTAQNRPRFILLGLREDVYSAINKSDLGKTFRDALKPSKQLFDCVKSGDQPKYGSLPCFDINKDPSLFETDILSSLKTHGEGSFVSVKEAIDDLRSDRVVPSAYVEALNGSLKNKGLHKLNKNLNHDLRANGLKVKARFRIYQIMTKLEKEESREISKFLKSYGQEDISFSTLTAMQEHWVLDTDGSRVEKPTNDDLKSLLKKLYTKKQTQRALRSGLPAPAALSIPDDACHYYESNDLQRTLTVREMARIQSFPDWYQFKSKVTTGGKMRKFEVPQYTQVGNAVPPLLGIGLGKVCKKLLELASTKK
jgi:DNA (cytosine-5)-methyltransferase 1